jgi:arginase family enzyme
MPATFPAAGGLTFDELHEVLDELVLSGAEIVGAEVTSASAPHAQAIGEAIAPLLEPRG